MFWLKTTHFTQWLFAKQLPYFIIRFYISNRIASRGFTDWVLIYHFYLRNAIYISCNRFMKTNFISKLHLSIFAMQDIDICFTKVVFPLPLTPLTTQNTFNGNSTVIFFKIILPCTFYFN